MTYEQMQRAAIEVLRNDLILELFGQLESDAINEWRGSDPLDEQTRQVAYYKQRALTELLVSLNNLLPLEDA